MTSPSNPQHEPTMEEILASIRKIISEDQPEPARQVAEAPQRQAEPDVLDLTEELHVYEPEPVQPAASVENDIAFEAIEERPAEEMEHTMDDDNDLISDSTRHALHHAFEPLDESPAPQRSAAPAGGSLEAVFTHAVQEAFEPTLQHWVDSHSDDILDHLKPMIRAWMDENLPSLIEGAVQKEISRAVAVRRKR